MNTETRWISLLSALMLLIGILLGIAMDRFLFRPPLPAPVPSLTPGSANSRYGEMALRRLTRNLDLSAEQQDKMREIFRRYAPELRGAGMGGGDLQAIRTRMREEIRGVLTPAQFKQFEQTFRKRMEIFRRMSPEGTPAPPAR